MDEKQRQALSKALESHHGELASLSQQIERLEQQRAIIKGAVIAELAANSEALRLPKEAIGQLVAGCW